MVVSGNRYLNQSEMLENANYIVNKLTAQGWTKESVAGMLGNMETESTINPGIWQNQYEHPENGYGLVQWTPATKLLNWLDSEGIKDDMDGQLARINWEVENNVQWISTSAYPMSFSEFKSSTDSPEELAQAFLLNYERPANQNQPGRSTQARYWYDNTDGSTGGGGGDGSGRQLAVLPIDVVNITQGEYGSFSHYSGSNQELAIDFLGWGPNGRINRYPLQAPFDSEVIGVLPEFAQVNWRNTVPVKGADGKDYENLVYTIVHDWDYNRWSVGDTISKGEHIGNTGSAGQSTGDHLHLQVIEAETHLWPTPISAQRHIYDIFDTKHVTMWINDGGYDWKELDYQDGTGGGGDDGQTSTKGDIYYLLLSGAMAGW